MYVMTYRFACLFLSYHNKDIECVTSKKTFDNNHWFHSLKICSFEVDK